MAVRPSPFLAAAAAAAAADPPRSSPASPTRCMAFVAATAASAASAAMTLPGGVSAGNLWHRRAAVQRRLPPGATTLTALSPSLGCGAGLLVRPPWPSSRPPRVANSRRVHAGAVRAAAATPTAAPLAVASGGTADRSGEGCGITVAAAAAVNTSQRAVAAYGSAVAAPASAAAATVTATATATDATAATAATASAAPVDVDADCEENSGGGCADDPAITADEDVGGRRRRSQAVSATPAPSRRLPRKRHPHGYWADWANVSAEVLAHVAATSDAAAAAAAAASTDASGSPPSAPIRCMPTARGLRAAGRRDLENAITRHGGFTAVGERLRLPAASAAGDRGKRRPHGYWSQWGHLAAELRVWAVGAALPGAVELAMPTRSALLAAGRSDLIEAIGRHGGFVAVAKRAGLCRKGRARRRLPTQDGRGAMHSRPPVASRGRWRVASAGRQREAAAALTSGRRRPVSAAATAAATMAAEAAAAGLVGGDEAAAAAPGGAAPRRRGYWKEWANVAAALDEWHATHGTDLPVIGSGSGGRASMPSAAAVAVGRDGRGIGRGTAAASAAALADTHPYSPHLSPHPRVLPRQAALRSTGHAALASAIDRYHGGSAATAQRAGMVGATKPKGYWFSFPTLASEVYAHLDATAAAAAAEAAAAASAAATDGSRATASSTTTDSTIGGGEGRRERVTRPGPPTRPDAAIRSVLPRQAVLVAAGRSDLVAAITRHGGLDVVARRLGLSRPPRRGRTANAVPSTTARGGIGGSGPSVSNGNGWAAFAASTAAQRTVRGGNAGSDGGGARLSASGGEDRAAVTATVAAAAAATGIAFHDVAREVLAFAATHGGAPEVMPTPTDLQRLGRGATAVAVGMWGWAATAARLGLALPVGMVAEEGAPGATDGAEWLSRPVDST
ncbi:hypothetical protein MMPV_003016 [Pyropia vietnamensis]